MQNEKLNIADLIKETLKVHSSLEGVRLYTEVRDVSHSRHNPDFPELYHRELEALRERGEVFFKERGEYFSAGKWHKSGAYSLAVREDGSLVQ